MESKALKLLKEQPWYDKWEYNLHSMSDYTAEEITAYPARKWITNAFSWIYTKEGYDYWNNIELQWWRTLKENNDEETE